MWQQCLAWTPQPTFVTPPTSPCLTAGPDCAPRRLFCCNHPPVHTASHSRRCLPATQRPLSPPVGWLTGSLAAARLLPEPPQAPELPAAAAPTSPLLLLLPLAACRLPVSGHTYRQGAPVSNTMLHGHMMSPPEQQACAAAVMYAVKSADVLHRLLRHHHPSTHLLQRHQLGSTWVGLQAAADEPLAHLPLPQLGSGARPPEQGFEVVWLQGQDCLAVL